MGVTNIVMPQSEVTTYINPLPNDEYLDWSKFKVFAVDKTNVTQKQKFFLGLVENIAEKGENPGYQHFLLMFSKGFFFRIDKSRDCVVKT